MIREEMIDRTALWMYCRECVDIFVRMSQDLPADGVPGLLCR